MDTRTVLEWAFVGAVAVYIVRRWVLYFWHGRDRLRPGYKAGGTRWVVLALMLIAILRIVIVGPIHLPDWMYDLALAAILLDRAWAWRARVRRQAA